MRAAWFFCVLLACIAAMQVRNLLLLNTWYSTTNRGSSTAKAKHTYRCRHHPHRNFSTLPVLVYAPFREPASVPCSVPCVFSSDARHASVADCILMEIPGHNLVSMPTKEGRTCPHQKFALLSMESEVYYPQRRAHSMSLLPSALSYRSARVRATALNELKLEVAREQYDIVGTTRLDSDVPLIYGSWSEYNFLQVRVQG